MVLHTGIFGRVHILSVKIGNFYQTKCPNGTTGYPKNGFLYNFLLRTCMNLFDVFQILLKSEKNIGSFS